MAALTGAREAATSFSRPMHGNVQSRATSRVAPKRRCTTRQHSPSGDIGSQRDEAITPCNFADLLGAGGKPNAQGRRLPRPWRCANWATATRRLSRSNWASSSSARVVSSTKVGHAANRLGTDAQHRQPARAGTSSARRRRRARAGDYDDARSTLEQALALTRAAPNKRIESTVIAALGNLPSARTRGCRRIPRRRRDLAARGGRPPLLADLLCTRGLVDLARADRPSAEAALSEAEQFARAINAGPTSNLTRRKQCLRTAITA